MGAGGRDWGGGQTIRRVCGPSAAVCPRPRLRVAAANAESIRSLGLRKADKRSCRGVKLWSFGDGICLPFCSMSSWVRGKCGALCRRPKRNRHKQKGLRGHGFPWGEKGWDGAAGVAWGGAGSKRVFLRSGGTRPLHVVTSPPTLSLAPPPPERTSPP